MVSTNSRNRFDSFVLHYNDECNIQWAVVLGFFFFISFFSFVVKKCSEPNLYERPKERITLWFQSFPGSQCINKYGERACCLVCVIYQSSQTRSRLSCFKRHHHFPRPALYDPFYLKRYYKMQISWLNLSSFLY